MAFKAMSRVAFMLILQPRSMMSPDAVDEDAQVLLGRIDVHIGRNGADCLSMLQRSCEYGAGLVVLGLGALGDGRNLPRRRFDGGNEPGPLLIVAQIAGDARNEGREGLLELGGLRAAERSSALTLMSGSIIS